MHVSIVIFLIGCTFLITYILTERKNGNEITTLREEFYRSLRNEEIKFNKQAHDLENKYNNSLSAMEQAGMNRAHADEMNYMAKINDLKKEVDSLVKEGRKDAVRRSKQVVSGQVYEQISPLVPGFPYELRDTRHVGSPLDFIIFRGLSGSGDIEIVFLEVKTGASTLNSNERRVKRAVESGRVKYDVFHPDLDHNIEEALEASITPIRPDITADGSFINPGEIVLPKDAGCEIIENFTTGPTEILKCGHCKKEFERPISAGRKPLFCPTCRGTG